MAPPRHRRRAARRFAWVLGLVVVLAGGVLIASRVADNQSDQGAEPWVSEAHGASGALVVDGDRVCSTTSGGILYCVDAATGEEAFSEEIGDSVRGPVLVDDMLLVGSAGLAMTQRGVGVYAYSLDGERLWYAQADLSHTEELPIAQGVVSVTDGHSVPELVGIDVATGEERWRVFTEDPPDAPLLSQGVFSDGARFYVVTQVEVSDPDGTREDAVVLAVDPATGTELWRANLGPDLSSLPTLGDVAASEDGSTVTLVVRDSDTPNQLVVLETAAGAVVRQAPLTGDYASLVQVGGATIVADGANLTAYDSVGQQLWAAPAPSTEANPDPTLTEPRRLVQEDGHLYLAGDDVFEIDPATGSSTLVAESVHASDVAVTDELLILSGSAQLEARELGAD